MLYNKEYQMIRAILRLLIFTVLVSACGPLSLATPLATQSAPELAPTWTLKMHQTGGIMGLSRSIEISSDGKYTITDERQNKTVEGQLSSDQIAQLRDLLITSMREARVSGPNGACADCFIYDIELNNAGQSFSARSDDMTLPDSGLEPLVTFLRDLIDRSLK
jgi:hypothetical protein